MISLKHCVALLLCLCALAAQAGQTPADSLKAVLAAAPADTNRVNTLNLLSKELMRSEPAEAIRLSQEARQLAAELDFTKGQAYARKGEGMVHFAQGGFADAITHWEQALTLFEAINDQNGIANMLSNIGVIYYEHGEYDRAVEYYLRSLKTAEQINNKLRIATVLINLGTVFGRKVETQDRSIKYLKRALALGEELQDNSVIGTTSVNIGTAYLDKGDYKTALTYLERSLKAYEGLPRESYSLNKIGVLYSRQGQSRKALGYQTKALQVAREFNSRLDIARVLLDMGNTYLQLDNPNEAMASVKEALQISSEIKSYGNLNEANIKLAEIYARRLDYKNAYKYFVAAVDSRDSLFSIEAEKKLAGLAFNFDLEKKQGQIDLLNKDKELQAVIIQRQKFAKNAFMVGMFLVFIIAFVIYRNYRMKVKTNRLLDKQKVQIENLLLNILPAAVASELQTEGKAQPRFFDSVSVLFSDFKNFTVISEGLSASELLDLLSQFFGAFDRITEKHGLEKIKTIGDSYMCAGGLPLETETHATDIVKAALEIQEYMFEFNTQRRALGLVPWELRIGIHSGPVVAGVVGTKKYAYDIWGSTVNIASRMESNGEANKVNISSATYELVKEEFPCTYRGRISAKSLGEVDMYFVNTGQEEPIAETHGQTIELADGELAML